MAESTEFVEVSPSTSSSDTRAADEKNDGDRARNISGEVPQKKQRISDHPPKAETTGELSVLEGAEGPALDDDDLASEISNLSGLEDELQEGRWRPNQGPMAWVQLQMMSGVNPRTVLSELLPSSMSIPDHVDSFTLWGIVISILSEPPSRKKLKTVNTLDDAVSLIKNCKKILVLTGAGISVSCGIPDFRSRDGIYSRLAVEYPDLHEPQDMFDIHFFTKNPKPFFKFASEIYPGKFEPSISHKFIRKLEENGKLLRNYTQNIDTLEQVAQIQNVIQCHGSFATASCMVCKQKVKSDDVKEEIMLQKVPLCSKCHSDKAVMKPDIVFFGEGLPDEFHKQMEIDKDQCDLLIVIGSSLKVRPVALIPNSLPADIPQILINREPLRHLTFDVELLGNCDGVIDLLANRLGDGFNDLCNSELLREISHDDLLKVSGQQVKELDESSCDGVTEEVRRCHLCLDEKECDHTSAPPETADSKAKVAPLAVIDEPSTTIEVEKEDVEATKCVVASDIKTTEVTPSTSSADDQREMKTEEGRNESPTSDSSIGASTSSPHKEADSLAKCLPNGTYAFLPPNRYLFPGGELSHHSTHDMSDDSDSSDSDVDTPSGGEKEDESIGVAVREVEGGETGSG